MVGVHLNGDPIPQLWPHTSIMTPNLNGAPLPQCQLLISIIAPYLYSQSLTPVTTYLNDSPLPQ